MSTSRAQKKIRREKKAAKCVTNVENNMSGFNFLMGEIDRIIYGAGARARADFERRGVRYTASDIERVAREDPDVKALFADPIASKMMGRANALRVFYEEIGRPEASKMERRKAYRDMSLNELLDSMLPKPFEPTCTNEGPSRRSATVRRDKKTPMTTTTIAAIPTTYRGVRMRSRLEAKWARMFDQLGWRWEYEPLDFDGWIPDFLIHTATPKPLLVEVKPIFRLEDDVRLKIETALDYRGAVARADRRDVDRPLGSDVMWPENFEVLIVGAALFPNGCFETLSIGWVSDNWGAMDGSHWDEAAIIYPNVNPDQYGLAATYGSYHDRISGAYDGDRYMSPVEADECRAMWARATNGAQWQPDRVTLAPSQQSDDDEFDVPF
jgi:hypothetical protein